jgi:glycosyltransferase involved in cell wall biosynthesis
MNDHSFAPLENRVHQCTVQLSVVSPVFNEEENLQALYGQLTQTLESLQGTYEMVFVDDGSTDGGGQLLDELACRDPRVKVVHLRRRSGQTPAIMACIDHATGERLVLIDADLQNDPADIPKLLGRLDEGYDVCSGWRRVRRDGTLMRVWPSRLANWLISRISGVRLNDYGCTLKAYRRSALEGVRLYGEMHRFLPIYASWSGAKVAEIEVSHRPRTAGKSKYGLGRTLKVVLDLMVVTFLANYFQNPIYLFGGLGLISLLAALLSFAGMVYYRFWVGKSIGETPFLLLTVMLLLSGVILILLGLLAELVVRTYYESQGKPPYQIRDRRNLENRR